MKKKFLSLFLAFVMILGVIPANVFAEGEEQKTCTITFVASEDAKNLEYGIEGKEGKGPFTVNTGEYYSFNLHADSLGMPGVFRISYFVDGKKVGGIAPTEDTVVYVDYAKYEENYYPVEEFTERPEGFIKATIKAGDQGKLMSYDRNGLVDQREFYVSKFDEVDFSQDYSYHINFQNITKGYDLKKSENGGYDKNPKGQFDSDITLTGQYEKKDYTHTFIKHNGDKVTKTLPAQAKLSELKDFAEQNKSESPGEGYRFFGWESVYYNDDGEESFTHRIDWERASDWTLDENKTLREIWSKDHVINYYTSGFSDGHSIELVPDGETIKQIPMRTKFYEITKFDGHFDSSGKWVDHSHKSEEFDIENTVINRDYNILRVTTKPFTQYEGIELYVSSFPKKYYDTSVEGEDKVDLTGLVVGIKNGDKMKYIPYEKFTKYGIKTEPRQGDSVETLDGKSLKVEYKNMFTYSQESFEVKDDGFKKDSITSIVVKDQPKLDYKYDGEDENAKKLDLSGLTVTLTDSENNTRDVKFKDFKYYGLATNPKNGAILTKEDDGKPVKVYLESDDSKSDETKPLKVVSTIFDATKVKSVAFAEGTKTNYIVGDKLDLANLKAVLTDENENTKKVAYDKFSENNLTLTFEGRELDKNLAKEDSGKNLVLTLKDKEPVKLPISVVEFDINKVKEIAVKTDPKLKYESGDKLDLTALVVTLIDENEAKKEVPFAEFEANHLKTSIENGTLITNQKGPITISYKNGDKTFEAKTKDLDVTVIELASENDKTNAKDAIEKLENLSSEEKKDFQDKVDAEKAKAKVAEIVKAAEKQDAENKKIKDAKELQEAKDKAKEEVNKLENIDEEAKKAANKNIDNAKSKEEVNKILEEAKKKDAEAKANKELEEAKKEEAAAKEKEKAAEEAKATAAKAKAEADAKAAEAEKAKEEADAKAKEAEEAAKKAKEAAKKAKEAANAETDQDKKAAADAKAKEAEEAAKEAKAEADQKAKEANEAKAKAEDANAKATEAENNLKEAKEEVKQAEEKVEAKQKEVDKYKEKPGTIPVDPTPSPSQPNTNYNPFWFGYFVSNAKTDNKTDAKSGIATPVKLDSKVAIGSKTLKVTVNGVERKVEMDVAPFIANNRTMLPIRFVAEALGFKVEWDEPSRTVILTDKDNVVKIPVDTNKIIVNGNEYESDTKPILRNNRTTLPIANIARALGLVDGKDIIWDAKSKEVVIKREIEK
ncbi:stalk domain-containing protein [uncultured Peptoniphilus sp.]|uniref:stalk domain-containing protein n=1 Tax=uncultured Peptoniphilus sp. TaxID=254354 RepID=UPI002803E832|nr:stalk domain-containing protein [uncultured Peptoniphilus sp.]